MNLLYCFAVFTTLFGTLILGEETDHSGPLHNLIKRQAQHNRQHGSAGSDDNTSPNSNQQNSDSDQHGTPSNRRHFVSPDGQPYYEYRPPVSTSRGSTGQRSATSRVSVRDPGTGGSSSPIYSGSVGRSRTYDYPFGRERLRYTNQQTGAGDTEGDSSDQPQTQSGQAYYYSASQGAAANYRRPATNQEAATYSGQYGPSNQQPAYDAQALQEQELRRRQEELRRRHEEERRRQDEERRRLIEERRRQDEERRRRFYSQQNQENTPRPETTTTQPTTVTSSLGGSSSGRNQDDSSIYGRSQTRQDEERRRLIEERRRQDEERRRQDEERRRRFYAQRTQEPTPRPETTTTQPTTTYPRQRQPSFSGSYSSSSLSSSSSSSDQSSITPSRGGSSAGRNQDDSSTYGRSQTQYSQSGYEPPNQQYLPPNQQSGYSTQYQRQYRPQRPVYSSLSRTVSQQQPVYSSGSTTYYSGSQPVPNQGSRYYYNNQQRGTSVSYPGFRTQYDYGGQGQGYSQGQSQGQGQTYYRYYDPYASNSGGTGSSSYNPYGYDTQDNSYSDCPDTGIDLRINNLNCEQAVQQYGAYLCYTHEYTSRQCCEVCRPRKQAQRIGCEYGDHAEQCSSIQPSDCYDLRNRQTCCETCERLRRSDGQPGCEYGDMSVRCDNVRTNPGLCYIPDNQRLCCETCNRVRNATNPGCPWGDFNQNLCQVFGETSSNVRINCYSHQRRRMCCESCERLREWLPDTLPPDCAYGDRPVIFTTSQFGSLNCSTILSRFSVEECNTNPAVRVNCCHTCHRYLSGRG